MTTMVRPLSGATTEPRQFAAEHVAASNQAIARFFAAHVASIAAACRAMAGRFQQGGRLLVYGDAAQKSDVSHAVVEFLHPVIVGKRSLPAIALPNAGPGAAQNSLRTLGRGNDILLLIGGIERTPADELLLGAARDQGMLTLLLTGDDSRGPFALANFSFEVPSCDPCIVQETHEVLYHVLWELVHVFLDHRTASA